VSLVAILDADKEGFLRSPTSLIQTIGARRGTSTARSTCTPTSHERHAARDRRDQPAAREAGRLQHGQGIDPQPLRKKIADILDAIIREDADTEELIGGAGVSSPAARPRPRPVSRARAAAQGPASRRRVPGARPGRPRVADQPAQ